jgi:hypothetical protein
MIAAAAVDEPNVEKARQKFYDMLSEALGSPLNTPLLTDFA